MSYHEERRPMLRFNHLDWTDAFILAGILSFFPAKAAKTTVEIQRLFENEKDHFLGWVRVLRILDASNRRLHLFISCIGYKLPTNGIKKFEWNYCWAASTCMACFSPFYHLVFQDWFLILFFFSLTKVGFPSTVFFFKILLSFILSLFHHWHPSK